MSAFLIEFAQVCRNLVSIALLRCPALFISPFTVLQQAVYQEADAGDQCDDGGNQQVRSDIAQAVPEKLSAPDRCVAHEDGGSHVPGAARIAAIRQKNAPTILLFIIVSSLPCGHRSFCFRPVSPPATYKYACIWKMVVKCEFFSNTSFDNINAAVELHLLSLASSDITFQIPCRINPTHTVGMGIHPNNYIADLFSIPCFCHIIFE